MDNNSSAGSWFDEDGEEMEGFEATTAADIPGHHPRSHSGHAPPDYVDPEPGGRLSRELEQGFMDDSDDDAHDLRQLHGRR